MKKILLALLFLLIAPAALAAEEDVSAFKQKISIPSLDLLVPTVIELPLEKSFFDWPEFAVKEIESNQFQPYRYQQTKSQAEYRITKEGTDVSLVLQDNKSATFIEFELPEEGRGTAKLMINSNTALSLDTIRLRLARYVALPTSIEVRAQVNGQDKLVLSKIKMKQSVVYFPETSSRQWTLNMEYSQPLRITEIDLDERSQAEGEASLRFLVRPGMSYEVFLNPDRHPEILVGEKGNLSDPRGVKKIVRPGAEINELFVPSDIDKDGVIDKLDNCVKVANPGQEDIDGNQRGDECDDFDRDGVINSKDNCPDKPNRNQKDTDADEVGDVCDGEESRLTEKYPWLVWLGALLAAAVIGGLFIKTLRDK